MSFQWGLFIPKSCAYDDGHVYHVTIKKIPNRKLLLYISEWFSRWLSFNRKTSYEKISGFNFSHWDNKIFPNSSIKIIMSSLHKSLGDLSRAPKWVNFTSAYKTKILKLQELFFLYGSESKSKNKRENGISPRQFYIFVHSQKVFQSFWDDENRRESEKMIEWEGNSIIEELMLYKWNESFTSKYQTPRGANRTMKKMISQRKLIWREDLERAALSLRSVNRSDFSFYVKCITIVFPRDVSSHIRLSKWQIDIWHGNNEKISFSLKSLLDSSWLNEFLVSIFLWSLMRI